MKINIDKNICSYKKQIKQLSLNKGKTMIYKAFSIRDTKAGVYHMPFFKLTHAEAERDFITVANDPQSQVNQFAEDFDLFQVGEYDTDKGQLIPLEGALHITKAIHHKKASLTAIHTDNEGRN